VNYCEKYGMTIGKYSLSLFEIPSENLLDLAFMCEKNFIPVSIAFKDLCCGYLETALLKKLSELEENVAFVVGFIVLHRSLGLLALRFVNLQSYNLCFLGT
ncbi:hypothetical protein JG687_00007636, partial [Phytophthora cactorum]